MKILHFINNLGSGGAEKLLTDILPLMSKEGLEVHVAFCNRKVNVEAYEKRLIENGITLHSFELNFYNPLNIFSVVRLINKEKFDLVHAHLFPTQYWLAAASYFVPQKVKLIKTEHSVSNERKDYKILLPLERWMYSRYHNIINITEQVHENLANWLGHSKHMSIIENGVNLNQVREAAGKKTDVTFDETKFNLLMTGRFDGIFKDQKTLVKSLSLLPKDKFSLYFAGEGKAMDDIKAYAEELNVTENVHFLGMRTDVYTLMSAVDLNILSSNKEGLSGVTLESLASNSPFLGSDVEGINNIVPDQRFLYERGNANQLAEKILTIANNSNLYQEMRIEGNRFVQKFDIQTMADKYLHLYQNTLRA
ncbi:MAG: glycosyltransferase [Flavobacteriaceae bacterium]|nr:glycosyltransferase [Flavobacteriaceae bacterium]